VGVYEAKTTLPRLLEEVERGETVVITRHGVPIARLVPFRSKGMDVGDAIQRMREFREQHVLGPGVTIRDLIEEGRRF
jgi:prevent-host-death family protein